MASFPAFPTFYPTMEEFGDFNRYVQSIEASCVEFGVCKIVPPQEWVERVERDPQYGVREGYQIKSPITQQPTASSQYAGAYQLTNVVEQQKMKVIEYEAMSRAIDKSKQRRLSLPDTEEWTEKNLTALEAAFWERIKSSHFPTYGADTQGSIFKETDTSWNPSRLHTILDHVGRLGGITVPYLYFGQWRSMFAWHTEDMDLCAINYLHYGAPKQWYAVPSGYASKMEELAKKVFRKEYRQCPQFLRHKTTVLHPDLLQKHGIPVYRGTQQPHNFIITWQHAFHSGFNYGYNCAESVNFATPNWIAFGEQAVLCTCRPNYVYIDMDDFKKKVEKQKKNDSKNTEYIVTRRQKRARIET